jgi:hypothetical protein
MDTQVQIAEGHTLSISLMFSPPDEAYPEETFETLQKTGNF